MTTMACAVCGRVLSHYPGLGWGHTVNDELSGAADHLAVPVDVDDTDTRLRCDFCSAEDPGWILPASAYELGFGHWNEGDWAACGECARLLERNQWNRLVERAWAAHVQRQGPTPGGEAALRATYRQLRKHITGAVHPRES